MSNLPTAANFGGTYLRPVDSEPQAEVPDISNGGISVDPDGRLVTIPLAIAPASTSTPNKSPSSSTNAASQTSSSGLASTTGASGGKSSTTPSTTPSTTDAISKSSGYSQTAIIGASVGAAFGGLLVALIAVLLFLRWKRKNQQKTAPIDEIGQSEPTNPPSEKLLFGIDFRGSKRRKELAELEDTGKAELENSEILEKDGKGVERGGKSIGGEGSGERGDQLSVYELASKTSVRRESQIEDRDP